MANPHRDEVQVQFRGEPLKLKLSNFAICELEEHFGENMKTIGKRFEDPDAIMTKDIRAIYWAMMLEGMPEATQRDASELIDTFNHENSHLNDKVVELIFPKPEPQKTTSKATGKTTGKPVAKKKRARTGAG